MLVQQPCGYMHSSSIKGPLKVFCEQSNGKSDEYSPIQKFTIEYRRTVLFVACSRETKELFEL